MKFRKSNIIIIILSIVALIFYVVIVDGADNIIKIFSSVQLQWIIGSVFLMVVYWVLESVVLHMAVKKFHPKQKFKDSFYTSIIGQLFNCITPFASGGQPVQAYDMVKRGVPLGSASCALLIKFIVYQVTLTLYTLLILVFQWSEFSHRVSGFGYLVFIGFFINLGVVIGLLSICFFKKFTLRFCTGLINLLHKIKLIKNKEQKLDYIKNELDQFYASFDIIKRNKIMILKMAVTSAVQLTVFFSITYFVYLGFGLSSEAFITIISAQAFVTMISAFVPLPGAIGGAEVSFYTFFGLFFPSSLLNMSILFWRLITFYLPICVGMFFTIDFSRSSKSIKKINLSNTESNAVGKGQTMEVQQS